MIVTQCGSPGSRRSCIAFAIACVLIASNVSAFAQQRAAGPGRSGEALFRAVVFLEGPLTDQVAELKRLKAIAARTNPSREQRAALAKYRDSLVAKLREQDAAFFQTFEKDLRSGNRETVSRRIEQTAAAITKAVEADRELKEAARAVPGADPAADKIVIETYYAVIPYHIVLSENGTLTAEVRERRKLIHDRLVDSLVTSLKAGSN